MNTESRWVELYGGPCDGDMEEVGAVFDGSGTELFGEVALTTRRDGAELGVYRADRWAHEELRIKRLRWEPTPAR
jgi:hypothetical protein